MKYPYNKKVLLAGICISGLFLVIGTTTGGINLIRIIFIAVGLSLLFCSIKYQNSRRFGAGLLSLVGAFCYLVGISLGIRGIWSLLTQFQKMEWLAMLATTIFFIMSGYFSFKAVASIRKSGDKSIKSHIEKEGMLGGSNFDNLFARLKNEDPDVRREASRLLSKGSENLKMLISIYQNCLDSDPRRATLAGRVLGRMIVKESDEHAGAGIAQALFGINVSFIPCNCIHCGYLNRGIPAPPNGPIAGYYHQTDYHQTDEKGVYAIPVLCDSCGKDFFVVWDEDPR